MRFVAISDTHDNLDAVRMLVDELRKEKFEFVVHAGDVIAPFTLKALAELNSKLYIAFGNNDGERKLLTQICAEKEWEIGDIIEFPYGVVYHGTDPRITKILTKLNGFIVVGHTHEPKIEKGECILLNPGEVCGYLTGKKTYAIVEDGTVNILEL